ncbi:MAG: L,D-transpeptidase family protein [Pseudomonadota bacterium]
MRWIWLLFLFAAVPVGAEPTGELPSYVLQVPEAVDALLIAHTDSGELVRFERGAHGLRQAVRQPMSIGLNGVGKQRTGDQRTPLGVYFITETLPTTNLHEKYGPVAFPLDYPNAWDQVEERTGSGIWIHGVTPNSGPRPARDTDGCIALPNAELLSLQPYLRPLTTPVIVTEGGDPISPAAAEHVREQLLEAMENWSASFRNGDWHTYVQFYDSAFTSLGMNRSDWLSYRLQSHADRAISDVRLSDVLLIKDPEAENLYLARFQQTIVVGGRELTTIKRLYWRKDAEGRLRILTEDNG